LALELSEAASTLLREVAYDLDRLILRLSAPGGAAILKTNGRIFGDGTRGEQAWWESGIRQLVSFGLVEPQGARVLCITVKGYDAAAVL
jgi:hypothetical protein